MGTLSKDVAILDDAAMAEFLELSPATLDRRRRDGKLPKHATVGNKHYWRFEDVTAWLFFEESDEAEVALL